MSKPRTPTQISPFYIGMVRQVGVAIGFDNLKRLVEQLAEEPRQPTRARKTVVDDVIVIELDD